MQDIKTATAPTMPPGLASLAAATAEYLLTLRACQPAIEQMGEDASFLGELISAALLGGDWGTPAAIFMELLREEARK
jgi:hypothetical protein